MPRTMRVEHPGAVWHSKDRGHRREDILVDEVDRQDFKQMVIELMAGELGENPTAQSGSPLQPEGGAYRGDAGSHFSRVLEPLRADVPNPNSAAEPAKWGRPRQPTT